MHPGEIFHATRFLEKGSLYSTLLFSLDIIFVQNNNGLFRLHLELLWSYIMGSEQSCAYLGGEILFLSSNFSVNTFTLIWESAL